MCIYLPTWLSVVIWWCCYFFVHLFFSFTLFKTSNWFSLGSPLFFAQLVCLFDSLCTFCFDLFIIVVFLRCNALKCAQDFNYCRATRPGKVKEIERVRKGRFTAIMFTNGYFALTSSAYINIMPRNICDVMWLSKCFIDISVYRTREKKKRTKRL